MLQQLAHLPLICYREGRPMSSPCIWCGATRTSSGRHSVLYFIAKAFGLRLCECACCHRPRISRRKPTEDTGPKLGTAAHPPEPGHYRRLGASDMEPETAANPLPLQDTGIVAQPSAPLETAANPPSPQAENVGPVPVGPEPPLEPPPANCCPRCGSRQYRVSTPSWWEILLRRPTMARCTYCLTRFPYPRD
jgi:hypothetical protein